MAVLTTGAVVLGYVRYRTFAPFPAAPFPAAPFGWIVLAASASVVLGTAVLLVPGLLTRMRGSRLLPVSALR